MTERKRNRWRWSLLSTIPHSLKSGECLQFKRDESSVGVVVVGNDEEEDGGE